MYKKVLDLTYIYMIWILLHYTSSHIYVKLCTHNSIKGFILSPFLANSLHCNTLRWVMNNGADSINSMWVVLGTYISTKILKIK